MVDYNPWLHAIICDTLKRGGSQFDQWIHPQLIADNLEYNIL